MTARDITCSPWRRGGDVIIFDAHQRSDVVRPQFSPPDQALNGAPGIRQMHAILKSAVAQAVKWEILAPNPAAAVRGPKVGRTAVQTYDLEQTAQLIEAARGTRVFIPVLLAVLGGLRRGEIAALRWRHVDLAGAQLAVVPSVERTRAGVRYKEPKAGRERNIALSATLVIDSGAHRLRQAAGVLRVGRRLSDEDFVVAQADGSPLRPHSLAQEWVRFLARNRMRPRIRFHDLRHAHATHLLSSGVHPRVASERLGLSKVGIMLDLYSHVLLNWPMRPRWLTTRRGRP
jgi:integrase